MGVEAALIQHLMDVLRPIGGVSARRMFGGAGLFRDGVMFAIISGDALYLKADASTALVFEAEGLHPFVYATRNGSRTLGSYWRAPERLIDEDDEMREWCRRAAVEATRASATKLSVSHNPPAERSRRSRAQRND